MSTATSNPEDILAALERDDSQAVVVDEMAVKRIVMQVRVKWSAECAFFYSSAISFYSFILDLNGLT